MTGIGFDLQQIDRIVAGPRTPDIGDQRGGNAPLGGNPTELAGGAGVGAGIRQDDVRMFVFGSTTPASYRSCRRHRSRAGAGIRDG